jgi:hypothetical protein
MKTRGFIKYLKLPIDDPALIPDPRLREYGPPLSRIILSIKTVI